MLSNAVVSRSILPCRSQKCLQKQQVRHLKLLHQLFVSPPFPISKKNQAHLDASQPKLLPTPVDIELDLSHGPSGEIERLTLSEAQTRLKPLHYLDPSSLKGYKSVQDKELYRRKDKTYQISLLGLRKQPSAHKVLPDNWSHKGKQIPSGKQIEVQKFPRAGRGREVHYTIYTPPSHLLSSLAMAYGCLLEGCRIEFHLHQKSNDVRVQNTVDWALEHSLHLRPDVILKAMPEGTELLGLPATSKSHMGEELVWALELPKALSRVGCRTPDRIKKRAMWGHVQIMDEASTTE